MSLTAIFTKAPQRFAEAGPSMVVNQPTLYRNPGISLRVFNRTQEIESFTSLIAAARIIAVADLWVISYASVTAEPKRPALVATYVNAKAGLTPEPKVQIASHGVPDFDIEEAHAYVHVAKKARPVSIEV